MKECIHPDAQIVTDEHPAYGPVAANYVGGHETVNHTEKEYARQQVNKITGEVETITTNTVEAYFSLLKRGIYGTFHHVSKKHLHRYCSEFDFRWNGRELEDSQRRDEAVKGAEGKRLYYSTPIARVRAQEGDATQAEPS